MKKQLILLLVCALFAAGLGGVLLFLNGYTPNKVDQSSATAHGSTSLLQKKASELTSITVTNEAGGFTITFSDGGYRVAGLDESIPLAKSKVEGMRSAMLNVQAATVVGQVSDLADFGLGRPRAAVKADYTDGTVFMLDIGADAPANKGIYCKTADGTVSVIPVAQVEHFLGGLTDLVDTTVTELPESSASSGSAGPQVQKVTFAGPAHKQPVSIERKQDPSAVEVYRMTSPGQGSVRSDQEQMIAGLLGIKAEKAVAVNPGEEQLESFGLKDPYSTAEFTYNDNGAEESCLLLASAPSGGTVYLMREGRPVIYQASKDNLPWLEMGYGDFVSTKLPTPNLEDLQSVSIAAPEKQVTFDLAGEQDSLKVTCGGEPVDAGRFRSYYQSLTGLPADAYTEDAPATETPLLTIIYTYRDSSKQAETIRCFAGQARQAILQASNGDRFLIREKYLETLTANTQAIQSGGEIEELS